MELISIVIALITDTYFKQVQQYRQFDWFWSYQSWVQQKLASQSYASGPTGLLILLIPVCFLVWLVDTMLGGVWGFFSFAFGIVVLIYSLGPRDLDAQVQDYLDSISRDDTEGALLHASEALNRRLEGSPSCVADSFRRGILLTLNNRMLGVMFWFVVLGPVGALLYRLSCLLVEQQRETDSEFSITVNRLYAILAWVPARISVICFAFMGSFIESASRWESLAEFVSKDSDTLIIETGLAALKLDTAIVDENAAVNSE